MAHLTQDPLFYPPENGNVKDAVVEMDKIKKELQILKGLMADQSNSFNDPKFSDFTVICGEKEFKVHRVILGSHSDVLLASFEHDMVERQTSSITFKDLDADLVEKMLKFMYSGEVEDLEEVAHDLFVLADRFNVKGLQELCLDSLAENICISNIFACFNLVSVFELSDVAHLKQKAIEFATTNIELLKEQESWPKFVEQNGNMVAGILDNVLKERGESEKRMASNWENSMQGYYVEPYPGWVNGAHGVIGQGRMRQFHELAPRFQGYNFDTPYPHPYPRHRPQMAQNWAPPPPPPMRQNFHGIPLFERVNYGVDM